MNHMDQELINKLRLWTNVAIEIIGNADSEVENNELCHQLIFNDIPWEEAFELVIFLPIAFCRAMLPGIKWPTEYVDFFSKEKKVVKKYRDNMRYQIMEEETRQYLKNQVSSEFIINIAGRSSDFHVINDLLNQGGDLEDVILTETYIIRHER
jgi:hypothetical protein